GARTVAFPGAAIAGPPPAPSDPGHPADAGHPGQFGAVRRLPRGRLAVPGPARRLGGGGRLSVPANAEPRRPGGGPRAFQRCLGRLFTPRRASVAGSFHDETFPRRTLGDQVLIERVHARLDRNAELRGVRAVVLGRDQELWRAGRGFLYRPGNKVV